MRMRIPAAVMLASAIVSFFTGRDAMEDGDEIMSDLKFSKDLAIKFGAVYDTDGNMVTQPTGPDKAAYQNYLMTMNPDTKTIPADIRFKVQQDIINKVYPQAVEVYWDERGPSWVGGRTRAVMFDPNDPAGRKVWAGSVSGGLWFTPNILADPYTWYKVDDFWDNLAVSAIAYDPNNTNVFYVGTGEGRDVWGMVAGNGIWKSTDGGVSWNHIAATNTLDFQFTQKIVVHPVTSHIYAATRSKDDARGGLLRSTDNGNTWHFVLSTTTSGIQSIGNRASDIELSADNKIFVSFGMGSTDRIYRSDTGDEGSWLRINLGIPENRRRIELAAAPSDPNILYAAVEDTTRPSSIAGLYKTTNQGGNWIQIPTPMFNDTTTFAATQGWYDLILKVHPLNPSRLYAGGVWMFRTTNSGSSWMYISNIHSDHHEIAFRPGAPDEVLFAGDGGLFYTENAWATTYPHIYDRNNGYRVTQFYSCTMHPASSVNYYIGGTQDNGTIIVDAPGLSSGRGAVGGDGGLCFIHPRNTDYQFASYINNCFYRTTNNGYTWENMTWDRTTGRFINPADYDPEADILYSAFDNSSIQRIRNATGSYFKDVMYNLNLASTASFIKVSPYEENVIYVGAEGGNLYRITDTDGANWNCIHLPTPIFPNGWISCIEFGASAAHLVVTFSNYGVSSVFETKNGGSTWNYKEGDLPDLPVRYFIFNPGNRSQAMVATEVGVWFTENFNDVNPNWAPANKGFPNVRTDMLKVRPSDCQVLAATYGRGMFSTDAFSSTAGQKITASDGSDLDYFGSDVSVSGSFAVVGAQGTNTYTEGSGAAYILQLNASGRWVEKQKLMPLIQNDRAQFGNAVSMDGYYAVIGAINDSYNGVGAGAAYIFKYDGSDWVEIKKIVPSDPAPGDAFGSSVAVYGERVVVGAPGKDSFRGAAYIFTRNDDLWTEEQKITDPAGEASDKFGSACTLSSDEIFIGSIYKSVFSDHGGAVITFRNEEGTWNYKQIISLQHGDMGDLFGASIAVYQDKLIVGATGSSNEYTAEGMAAIYRKNGTVWELEDSLRCVDADAFKFFGSSVSVFEDHALIGAENDKQAGTASGSAYVYKFNGSSWQNKLKILPQDGAAHDLFGSSVSLFGPYAVITSKFDDDKGMNSGSVHAFSNLTGDIELCMLSVNNEYTVSRDAQQLSIRVRNAGLGNMSWSSYCTSEWFTITSGSGSNTGYIDVQVQANDYCAREGELVVYAPGALNSPVIVRIKQEQGYSVEQVKMLSSDISEGDRFGQAVAIDGNYAVVGAYGESGGGFNSGAVYVFERSGCSWTQSARLTIAEAAADDRLGYAVDICGDYIIAGAPGKYAAYIYEKPAGGWNDMTESAKLTFSEPGGQFATAVAISTNEAIIGAWESNKIYLYDKAGEKWKNATENFCYTNAPAYGYLGLAVDIKNGMAVAGAQYATSSGKQTGAVYIFKKYLNWYADQKITPRDADHAMFGTDVALDGNVLAVTSPAANNTAGAVYIYRNEYGSWKMTDTLKPDYSTFRQIRAPNYGSSVGVSGDNIIVGAWGFDFGVTDAGAAFIYGYNGTDWVQKEIISAADTLRDAMFGYSVGVTRDFNICGGYNNSGDGNSSGAAYINCNTPNDQVSFVEDNIAQIPAVYRLEQNYPNPFNPATVIQFGIKENTEVTLEIFDLLGRRVALLINEKYMEKGSYKYEFNSPALASGVYIYRLRTKTFTDARKMVLLK